MSVARNDASAVSVAIRCRPMSPKEIREGSKSIVSITGQTTNIVDPAGKLPPLTFTFDHSFWSTRREDPHFATQEVVFEAIGSKLVNNAFEGFNGCLFAYGQTGSGKTYTMMGYGQDKGVIPRVCDNLFLKADRKLEESAQGSWAFQVQASYLEIYNEKCRCLLTPVNPAKKVEYRVREHPTMGPYVENLAKIVVRNFADIDKLMEEGNKLRTVAATQMNATSSRSHAIFMITFTQRQTHVDHGNAQTEMSSRINLVDLAGSERADRTGATGDTLKEGSNINTSLTTLGKVIMSLAEGFGKDGKPKRHAPFRDSQLTWLLKENLSGNSKTFMLATLSPADSNYEETVSTLRYADQAKKLTTSASVNEDPTARKLRELTQEIERLKALVAQQAAQPQAPVTTLKLPTPPAELAGDASPPGSPRGLLDYEKLSAQDKLALAARILEEESMSWEDKERQTLAVQIERNAALQAAGITTVTQSKDLPRIVNLNEDPSLSECLMYYLRPGKTPVGSAADTPGSIRLGGKKILPHHCHIELTVTDAGNETFIVPDDPTAVVLVNGMLISERTELFNGNRIIFGDYLVFRYSDPKAFTALREEVKPTSEASGAAAPPSSSSFADPNAKVKHEEIFDYHRALEERFEQERAAWLKDVADKTVEVHASFVMKTEERQQQDAVRLEEMKKRVDEMEKEKLQSQQRANVSALTSISGAAQVASQILPTEARAQSLSAVAQLSSRKVRRKTEQRFRHKLLLLGHQEVGKTSLRICFEKDPMFFLKKLPEVRSTTGIESLTKSVSVGEEGNIELSIEDFAGQESYHSHTIFLTSRSLFILVWKISSVEQDFFSRGISEEEEARLCKWVAEVYSKFPESPLAIVATHWDELRDSSQRSVEAILSKIGKIIMSYATSIARVTGRSAQPIPMVGNFAVSCKNRTFTGIGPHAKLQGKPISELLKVLATAAMFACKADKQFPEGAIPGRHLQLIDELASWKRSNPTKMLMHLTEYVQMGLRVGVEDDVELQDISQLLHSWGNIFMFNQNQIVKNPFLFMYPSWLCKLAGVLFSCAHVLSTPMHLRNVISGLEYRITDAETADLGLLSVGYLRYPLVRVLFRQSARDFNKTEPDDADFDMCLELLIALELIFKVVVTLEDGVVAQEESSKGTFSHPTKAGGRQLPGHQVVRFFVPSLSPFKVPKDLVVVAPLVFNRGCHLKWTFNLLSDECWWRLTHRMSSYAVSVTIHAPRSEDDMYLFAKEVSEWHNRWRDGMWLGTKDCRVFLHRASNSVVRLYSVSNGDAADEILRKLEETMIDLLAEFKGIQRTTWVQCPVPNCQGWHDIASLQQNSDITCGACSSTYPVAEVVVNGTSKLGASMFSPALCRHLRTMLSKSVDATSAEVIWNVWGIISTERSIEEGTHVGNTSASVPVALMNSIAALDKLVQAAMTEAYLATQAPEE